jgi:uncharacterized membrane protein YphA (DoxX/SURF4 family)
MLYASLPLIIVAMMAYMFWHAGFSMRRDRVLNQRAERRLRWVPQRIRMRARQPR